MMPPRSKEEIVQEYRMQSIQEAAMRVIARKGMDAATMQEIAEEAGIAKGTIYLYFRDRDELVEKTFERAITDLHKRIDAALDAHPTFEQKFRASLSATLAFFRENREFFRLYSSMRFPVGTPQQQRRQKRTCQPQYQSHLDRLAGDLRQAMARGEVREMDADRLAIFLVEGSNAIVMNRIMSEAPPPEEDDLELIVSAVLDGIAVRKPKRSAH